MVKKLSNKPYPSFEILNYVVQNGGKLVLTSDSHRAANIGKYFDEMTQIYHEYLIDASRMIALKFNSDLIKTSRIGDAAHLL